MAIEGLECGMYYLIKVGGNFTVRQLVEMKKCIEQAMEISHQTIIFELSACEFIDSSGLGLLARLHKKLSKDNGKVGVLKPSKVVEEALQLSNLSMIKQFQSEEDLELNV